MDNKKDSPIKNIEKHIQLKNGRKILLRMLRYEDLDDIWDNFSEVVKEKIYLPVYTSDITEWEKYSWYEHMTHDGNFCIVAIDYSKKAPRTVIGQCTIEDLEWEAASHVGQLGIIIQSQYRNLGLGYELILFCKEIAKQKGKRKLILSTLATNKRGLSLYKKCGFKQIGIYKKQYFIENEFIDEILMETFL